MHRAAAPVEIEPPVALERQLVGGRIGVAAALLNERGLLTRPHEVGRQPLPLVGKRRLLRVDPRDPFDRREAKIRPRLEDPDLLIVPGPTGIGPGNGGRRPLVARHDHDREAAGAHLQAKAAVRLEARGQRARHRQRHEPTWQDAAEQLLAALPGNR